ncbi:YhfT family protein [Breznakiella homolactica]|uniref:YhfT family protein n=1 Tax=Breznakiella homolactica TaxID=2798577 RepID=A0A7T8BC01_9SPIR|nr:YhfT family protein [Breznakiella homolactica]QQO10911.1 YhfT family protein [Breznakiella homolactica]
MAFDINVLTVLVMAALGGICAYLANQNIAVFNDGTRPMYGPYLNGEIDRKTLFATSFALSFGLVIGFGLPTSIAGRIIIVHTIMLACDIIGALFKEDTKGMILSTAIGAAFGVLLMFGMQTVINLFALMPIDFLGSLSTVGGLIVILFCVFPALAVAYQTNALKGIIVLALTMLVKHVTFHFGKFTIKDVNIALNSDGTALLFGIVAMVFVAARTSKRTEGSAAAAFAVFEKNIDRIKKNLLILAISGGIVALATTLLLIAEGPASLTLTAEGRYGEAAIVALGRCLGFIPLVMTTAIISGVYSPAGTKAVHVPAILFINMGIMGMVGSFFVGALIMAIEVLLLGFIAKGLDRFPGMKELGDNTRTAMSKILDISLLVGGMMAANAIAPTIGYIWVVGLHFLNQNSKKPISSMAIGPIGAISMGIIVNILYVIKLFPK